MADYEKIYRVFGENIAHRYFYLRMQIISCIFRKIVSWQAVFYFWLIYTV